MVLFFSQDCDFKLIGKMCYKRWLKELALLQGAKLGALNVIFCSDAYLLKMNQDFLGHHYYTDVISFDSSDTLGVRAGVSGDIFMSIDTIVQNAAEYKVPFEEELRRVMAHGLLHLLGYKDGTAAEKAEMRQQEDQALRLYPVA
jgi:metalloprotein, YbeY/UPF0054 family